MKTYLLLRNNRQTGPHSLEALLSLGLKPQDLLWQEGHSASWRYPSEFDEFRSLVAPPVADVSINQEFTEVQNRILEAYPAEESLAPRRDIPEVFQQPLRSVREVSIVPSPVEETTVPYPNLDLVPAFLSIAGMLEDDEMPTIALQKSRHAVREMDVDVTAPKAASADVALPVGTPQPVRKIQVSLPAARADKTLVVIQRRDDQGRTIATVKSKPRRPVIEFVPDEHPVVPEPMVEPGIPVNEMPVPPSPVALLQTDADENPVEVPQLADAAIQPFPGEISVKADIPVTVPDLIGQSESAEILPKAAAPVTQTLQVNISLIQKAAVAAAILSLLVVAGLIANAVFNPNAYNYGTPKPVPASSDPLRTKTLSPGAATQNDSNTDTVIQESTVAK